MTIKLKQKETNTFEKFEFTVTLTTTVQDLYLALSPFENNIQKSTENNLDGASIKFDQIMLLKIQTIAHGIIYTHAANIEVQLAYIVNSGRFQEILIRSNLIEFGLKYYSELIQNNCETRYSKISIIDYKDYADIVNLNGGIPLTFQDYVIKCITNNN